MNGDRIAVITDPDDNRETPSMRRADLLGNEGEPLKGNGLNRRKIVRRDIDVAGALRLHRIRLVTIGRAAVGSARDTRRIAPT